MFETSFSIEFTVFMEGKNEIFDGYGSEYGSNVFG